MSPQDQILVFGTFPGAIVHFDGDAFFASVEQAADPSLKGRPVVTGRERGIIACASYEAKALGVRRGISLRDARKICPQLVVLPSDYETYSLYSRRMFDIARRFTPIVEEYSIDEGFADIGGLRRVFHVSYQDIAKQIQNTVREELNLTVSIGLSLTKSLAKLASDFRKPAGFTAVAGMHLHLFLQRIPLDNVWGFGANTVQLLRKHGLKTAYDFILKPEAWAQKMLGKPGHEIWRELRGQTVWPVTTEEKSSYASISKCKTFSEPSADRDYICARLVRNLESAFIKVRRHKLRVREITVALRKDDYCQEGLRTALNRPTSSTQEALPLVLDLFGWLFRPDWKYRSTMVVLGRLEEDREEQYDLFEDRIRIEKLHKASAVMDEVNGQFGKHRLHIGTGQFLEMPRHSRDRDILPWRKTDLLKGETDRRRLALPRLKITV